MRTKLILYLKPLLSVIFWGASFIATKIVLAELSPLSIIFMRLILAVSLLTVIAAYTKRSFAINLKSHTGVFILALIAVFHLWIQVTGLQYTSASNTGWIIGITPVFMAFLGFLFLKESVTPVKILGIIIAFSGLLLLISKGNIGNIEIISNKGDFLVLGSAFTWAVYSLVNKKISLTYPPMMTILFLFIMMAIIISPFTINEKFFSSLFQLSTEGFIAILFLGIFCSGIAYVFWAQALKDMESFKVGVFLYFEPFVTVFAAWLVLSEEITFLMLMSGIIITIGVALVNLNKVPSLLIRRKIAGQ